MRGAVQHKLHERIQHAPPTLAIVQRSSYGFVLDEEYDPARHTIHPNHSFDDSCTGRKMAGKQIRWLVKKVHMRSIEFPMQSEKRINDNSLQTLHTLSNCETNI